MRHTDHGHQAEERNDPQAEVGDEGHEATEGLFRRAYKVLWLQVCVGWQAPGYEETEGPGADDPVVRWKIGLGEKEE